MARGLREVDYIKLQNIHKGAAEDPNKLYWKDVEEGSRDAYLFNGNIATFAWNNISVSLTDKATQKDKYLLQQVSGRVQAGRRHLLRSQVYRV